MTEQSSEFQNQDFASFPPAIVLMGPTASGKSGIALEIARNLPVEIVSVDSAQVYRHMDIGTAKPDTQSMAAVPHHLINLIEPHERYSAAQFVSDALVAMREITERGNIPLLAGGTMLYFRALLEGLSELPSADASIRMLIETRAQECGWPALHNELLQLDPVSAARIQPTDSQRIQRALEVCYLAGKPMSEILKKPRHSNLPYRVIRVTLAPGDREVLHQRIAQRFEKMLELGLIDEVRAIRDKFCLNDKSPSMRCVGYRQVWMYLDNEISLGKMRDMAVAATRQLAKRQLTWLRPMEGVKKFDCLMENLPEHVWKYLRSTGLKAALVS
ncbi:tRNA (adenosine(37)-N6)-dimethylallyltransferase MiaA [Nitrosospira sp. Nsp13]|jgi:tRNA dimethylallyltransferase|uniref:tRNA (adenosine(37)-N6)-dimethylallyltransferase MiaA n=1 Tax=Nitrosospira sp. Nsp13 TaxID=1855332 RepID=UPI00088F87D7|nr:tRNA (adenosine(37)-N6)-dimethylallyltransferase MiaA [Nitrosospira sp. Nsp13]SCY30079.1 tRNA dimethylallyltransferase [Nitrosospira sp. Nsp13]